MRPIPAVLLALALAPASFADLPYALHPLGAYGKQLVRTAWALQVHTEWVSVDPEDGQSLKAAIEAEMTPVGWHLVGDVMTAAPDLRAYVAYRGRDIVVAFRGTWGDSLGGTAKNAGLDARVRLEAIDFLPDGKQGGVKIHNGFRRGYATFRDRVRERVAQRLAEHPKSLIYVTGHSLGGALATLAALDLDFRTGRNVQLVATGCPRVGNGKFADLVEERMKNMVRVSVIGDPVPGIPSRKQYDHAGRLLLLNPKGKRITAVRLAALPQLRLKARHVRGAYLEALGKHRLEVPDSVPGKVLWETAKIQDTSLQRGERGTSRAQDAKEKAKRAGAKARSAAGKVRDKLRRR